MGPDVWAGGAPPLMRDQGPSEDGRNPSSAIASAARSPADTGRTNLPRLALIAISRTETALKWTSFWGSRICSCSRNAFSESESAHRYAMGLR